MTEPTHNKGYALDLVITEGLNISSAVVYITENTSKVVADVEAFSSTSGLCSNSVNDMVENAYILNIYRPISYVVVVFLCIYVVFLKAHHISQILFYHFLGEFFFI